MLSLDILLEWRESFRRGVPVTVMIESKISSFINNHNEVSSVERGFLAHFDKAQFMIRALYQLYHQYFSHTN